MRNILFFSMTALLSLSGIIFAAAEGSPLAGLSLLIALATVYWVDLEERFAVPVTVANTLGILAFLVAGVEFFGRQAESRLLAGGHLIIYLTWVNLVQKKGVRQLWWLCALSVLQIATASVLTDAIWFGGALVVYLFLAIWTLSVFLLYRSTLGASDPSIQSGSEPESKFVVGDSWKGVSRDVDHRLLNARFVGITGTVTCLSLVISVLFFLFTPRVWIGNYPAFGDEAMTGRTLTGFTDEVRLGDMSEIMESSEPVLEVRLFNPRIQTPLTPRAAQNYLGPNPLFRGAVMEEYENGRWKHLKDNASGEDPSNFVDADIEQKYQLAPIGSATIFGFGDIVGASGTGIVRSRYSDEFRLRENAKNRDKEFSYSIYANFGPPDVSNSKEEKPTLSPSYLNRAMHLPRGLDRVKQLSQALVEDTTSDNEKMRRLREFFLGDEFTYSLNQSVIDTTIDPIEDFLFNRKSGHCEYYASALAIMLRSADVPARLISGFKGGNFEEDGQVFRVQQLHAHSWVEAYVNGQWVTLDPTPSAREFAVEDLQSSFLGLAAMWEKVQQYWITGIRLSQSQQKRLIYEPVQTFAINAWNDIRNLLSGNSEILDRLVWFLRSPDKWFSVTGGIVAFVLLLLLSGIVWVIKRIIRKIKAWREIRVAERKRRIQVRFYERFVEILSEFDIHQRPSQTAREFINDSLNTIERPLLDAGLSAWPAELVQKFYDVRFGGRTISNEDASRIDSELTRMKMCLQQQETERR